MKKLNFFWVKNMSTESAEKKLKRRPNMYMTFNQEQIYCRILNAGYLPPEDCEDPVKAVTEYFAWLGVPLKFENTGFITCVHVGTLVYKGTSKEESARKLLNGLNTNKKVLFEVLDLSLSV